MRFLPFALFFSITCFSQANLTSITILATNDIHGGVEPNFALWASTVSDLRKSNPNLILVDAGDQFQGTLISNYNEGQLVFSAMKYLQYDAVVPGNHDYDFGPIGWLVDQSNDPTKRLEALEKIAKQTGLPLISGNTFQKNSLSAEVEDISCRPKNLTQQIDWRQAKQPDFLKPYVIKQVGTVRVALIGIDNHETPTMTTPDNVADLCFGDQAFHYKKIRKELENMADVFVLIVHDGDVSLAKALTAPERLVDAIVSGHTHRTYNQKINGVPFIQSGANGLAYGRIDLVWDSSKKQLDLNQTQSQAGIRIQSSTADSYMASLLSNAREEINLIAKRPLGKALQEFKRAYTEDNDLADLFTQVFREVSSADIAFLNGGGLRANLPAGDLTYEDLFRIIPFSNHGFVLSPMKIDTLLAILERSAKTCGAYGALFQNGLEVKLQRNCSASNQVNGIDPKAKILEVKLPNGTLLYSADSGINPNAQHEFSVAVPDFLAQGGSGFTKLQEIPVTQDIGIMRERFYDWFTLKQPVLSTPQKK